MSTLRVKFVDDYAPFSESTCYLYNRLRCHFDLKISEEPDFLFYSVFGPEHASPRYDRCVRIWYTGENIRPDLTRCDYALSFDYLPDEPRHLRYPEYLRSLGNGFERAGLLVKPLSFDAEAILESKTRFCNFLYTNHNARTRMRFFRDLSKYKQVDSSGIVLNNMGRVVPKSLTDKLAFLTPYKFTIAFENARYPGYTTEKLVDPMLAGSIPIYWGNWQVGREFNTRSFVCCHEYASFEEVIEEIIRLDQDGGRYIAKMREPWLPGNALNEYMRTDYPGSQRVFDPALGSQRVTGPALGSQRVTGPALGSQRVTGPALVSFFARIFATPPHSYPRWSGVLARDYGLRTIDHEPEYEPPPHLIGPLEYRVFE